MYSIQMIDQQKHARAALNKFHRRKGLNASTIWIIDIVFVIALIIGLGAATISALMVNTNTAQPGKILAKSEMTKAELKTLNVVAEKRRHD